MVSWTLWICNPALYSHQRRKLKWRKRSRPTSVHLKSVLKRMLTTSVLSIFLPPSITLSFTWLISPVEKPTAESPVEWRLRLIEKNPLHTLVRNRQISQTQHYWTAHSSQVMPKGCIFKLWLAENALKLNFQANIQRPRDSDILEKSV